MNARALLKYLFAGFAVHVVVVACSHDRGRQVQRLVDAGEDALSSLLPDAARPSAESGASETGTPVPMEASVRTDGALADVLIQPVRDARAQDGSSPTCCDRNAPADVPENAVRGTVGPVASPDTFELAAGPLFVTDAMQTAASASSANLYTAATGAACTSVSVTEDPLFSLRTAPDQTASINGARFFVAADRKLCAQVGTNILFSYSGFRP